VPWARWSGLVRAGLSGGSLWAFDCLTLEAAPGAPDAPGRDDRPEPAVRSDAILLKRQNVLGVTMATGAVRSTIYLDPQLHQALRLKAAIAHRSISDLVNDAVRAALQEDEEDLAAFAERAHEQPISYEELLARLKANGTL
jgi:plasmid stability protein